jgi:hypothetical protein
MKRIARLLTVSIPIACCVLLGYAAGTGLVMAFLRWVSALNPGGTPFVNELLAGRYQPAAMRAPRGVIGSVASTIAAVVVLTLSVCTVFLARSSPPLPTSKSKDKPVIDAQDRFWRSVQVWSRVHQMHLFLLFGCGVFAAFASLLIDPWIIRARTAFDVLGVYKGVTDPVPGCVVGWLSYTDGVFVTVGIVVTAYFLFVRRTDLRSSSDIGLNAAMPMESACVPADRRAIRRAPLRLLWVFAPMAGLVLAGYAIGTIAVLAFLIRLQELHEATGSSAPVAGELLFYRYKFDGFRGYADTLHYSITATVVYLLMLCLCACLAFSLWPRTVSCCQKFVGGRFSRQRATKLWRSSLARSRVRRGHMLVLFACGLLAALASVLIDPWIMLVRTELDLMNVFSGLTNPTPVPVVGWLSYIDGTIVTVGIVAMGFIIILRPALRRVRDLKSVRRRWCGRCGYPLAAVGSRERVCSECGEGSPALTLGAR